MADEVQVKVEKPSAEARSKHADTYNKKRAQSIKTIPKETKTFPNGAVKQKFVETVKYENGVVKNKLVGVKKNGSQLWGREK
jgi:hypothetical protein